MKYRWKQQGPAVVALQEALVRMGFHLPKYGADGDLGGETWAKIELYAEVDQLPTGQPLPEHITDDIMNDLFVKTPIGAFERPVGYVRVVGDPNDVIRMRGWKEVDTIVVHQTGCWMTDTPERFRKLNAQMAILRDHATPIVQVQALNAYMYHANEANRFSIGFEINGLFPGLIKQFDSAKHSHVGPSDAQINNTRNAIHMVCEEFAAHGGEIKHIIPHRLANDVKRSDPGEAAWKAIGIWAQRKLGLTDKGPGWTIGDGTPLPGEWDDRSAYAKYRY